MKRFYLLWLLTFLLSEGFAQDIPVKKDSLKKITPTEALPLDTDTMKSGSVILKLPRLNPVMDLQPQFTPHNRFTMMMPYRMPDSPLPPIQWRGVASVLLGYWSSKKGSCNTPFLHDNRY